MIDLKAVYMFEMAESFYESRHLRDIKISNSLRLVIGYTYEQAIEMSLKYLNNITSGEWANTHHLHSLIDSFKNDFYAFKKQHENDDYSNVEFSKYNGLLQYISDIYEHARIYNNLAYAAKYDNDMLFSYNQLQQLRELSRCIVYWVKAYKIDFHDDFHPERRYVVQYEEKSKAKKNIKKSNSGKAKYSNKKKR